MTVVAWDGKALAVDRAGTDGTAKWQSEKGWYRVLPRSGIRVAITGAGPLQAILEMRDWYVGGAFRDKFPKTQQGRYWCHFLVLTPKGLFRYEQHPFSIAHDATPCAFGEGKDIALGAMAMGATAEQAVEVCNRLSPSCGLGVQTFTL